jgi:2,4-dienoyl-CoA reductase-like NADH-dependent reductase (Old Yellow Enzyme family)/thioredoxin reductase
MQVRYPNLLKPLTIRGKTFKNRMIIAPLGYGPVDNSGYYLHQENIDYYDALARGGTSRVITGDHPVNSYNSGASEARLDFYTPRRSGMGIRRPSSGGTAPAVEISRTVEEHRVPMNADKSIEFLVRVCHQHDTLVFTEFDHNGLWERNNKVPPWGPDDFVRDDGTHVVGMNKEMIESVYSDFARCSRKAMELGLDGVMIHGGHSHLQDQFRSRWTNHRTDEYGGSLENRCRFTIECLQKVREAVGENFLVEYRFSVEEGPPDGITVDESIEFLKMLDKLGIVDIYHVSTGIHFDPVHNHKMCAPPFYRNFYNEEACKKIKAAGIKGAVAMCNSVNDPEKAEQIIAKGTADFVTAARQFNIADPYFPRKVAEGKGEYINTCIRCYGCYEGNECGVNPVTPDKYYINLVYTLPACEKPKKVVIIGGGIAGMKAAEVAAEKGHDVTILEKTGRLGGLTRYADNDKTKSDVRRFRDNMIFRMYDNPKIKVMLNTEATPGRIRELDPFALIIAVGSHPFVPDIPGKDKPLAIDIMQAYDKPAQVGNTVALVGGGITACETAVHLADQGKKVYIINRRERLAYHENIMVFQFDPVAALMQIYAQYRQPVEVFNNLDCREVLDNGVRCYFKDGAKKVITADTVIFASGMRANTGEAAKFLALAPYVRTIGDCRLAGKIKHCITSGYYAAVDIDK